MICKVFLIKINDFKPNIVNIFGDIVENVYLEHCFWSHHNEEQSKEHLNRKLNRLKSNVEKNYINLYDTIVIEFKGGNLVYFLLDDGNGFVGKYTDEHEKVDEIPERIEF